MSERHKAIGLYSGGLDSILAARIMIEEGFEVTALHFYTGFNGLLRRDIAHGPSWKWTPPEPVIEGASKLGIRLVPLDVSDEYLSILLKPRYGYGAGANPCIDCRFFILGKAREIMESEGAALVFTGEVLGQRPMSQHKTALGIVERRSGLEGRLLRPLSAKHLDPTIPEREGIVNREHLYAFHGRSRKPQQELAARFGIDWYPDSGGGCVLTDKIFGRKFGDLIEHSGDNSPTRIELLSLKTGRHLRLMSGTKVIIGRTDEENRYLEELLAATCWVFDARDFPGATMFAFGEPPDEELRHIAAICARYGKSMHEDMVAVTAKKGDVIREFSVRPAQQKDIEQYSVT
ncbi:thiamine biosynthesis protein [bacterium]|nr:thiamine biosynthesis protein [bacterium]